MKEWEERRNRRWRIFGHIGTLRFAWQAMQGIISNPDLPPEVKRKAAGIQEQLDELGYMIKFCTK